MRSTPLRRKLILAGTIACLALAVFGARRRSTAPHRPQLDAQVVSGRAGLRKTPSGDDERWSQGPVTVVVDPTLAAASPTARDAIVAAFGAWMSTSASLPQVTVDISSTPGEAVQDGVNRLVLAPITVPGHESDLAITISYADSSTGQLLEADTIFNSAYPWASIDTAEVGDDPSTCGRRYDLQNVATHEAGHFFGLGEDYQDTTTTMYVSSRPCQTSKRVLTATDVSVISGLYAGSSPAAAASCGAHIARSSETNDGALAASCLLGCAAARRLRRRQQRSAR
jgi:hypothetical protein